MGTREKISKRMPFGMGVFTNYSSIKAAIYYTEEAIDYTSDNLGSNNLEDIHHMILTNQVQILENQEELFFKIFEIEEKINSLKRSNDETLTNKFKDLFKKH